MYIWSNKIQSLHMPWHQFQSNMVCVTISRIAFSARRIFTSFQLWTDKTSTKRVLCPSKCMCLYIQCLYWYSVFQFSMMVSSPYISQLWQKCPYRGYYHYRQNNMATKPFFLIFPPPYLWFLHGGFHVHVNIILFGTIPKLLLYTN